ncbi:flagellar basal body-associated protein FliL [uncultured Ferrimonas sp.]|uniref:flagellar basal body-associated protein FliL n=1 Tax=uncultured Ferrimonas sp. TaxID=432640 RepID=UPI002616BA8C|nr:flagellar basal body-associated protein FliL [uncultured Ferrimonas sp.]
MAEESLELEVKPQSKSRKKLIIIVVALVLVLGLGGAAAWFFMGSDDSPATPTGTTTTDAAKPMTASYVSLPRPFLFNLPGDNRGFVVQIKVQLQVRSEEAQVIVRKHTPLLRDALLTTFSSAEGKNLRSREGKEELRARALLNVQTAMQSITGHPQVERVLFTGFVMQ